MRKAILLSAFLVLTGVEATAGTPFDERFIRQEAQGSTYELDLARLGQARSTRPDVRAYAATLINDHEAYNRSLRELANSKGIMLQPGLASKDRKRLDRLAGPRGAGFDAAFIREAQRVNSADIRTLHEAASRTADPEIRSFVARFQEVDEKHAAAARALSVSGGASRMPLIDPPRTGDTISVPPPASDSNMPTIAPPPRDEK